LAKEYKISIDNNLVGLEQVGQSASQEVKSPIGDQNAKAEALAEKTSKFGSISKAIAVQMGKQALNYALSNYGSLTGDYITQNKISEMLEVGSLIAMAASGWVGAAAAIGAVAVKAVNRYVDVKKSEIQSNAMQIRTGGSRH
jgi:hypothetical protein